MQPHHPPTLRVFFATEMWERYGFYVVQTLLALYLALHFQWHDKRVYALVGSFTALTYLSPVIGGWIADHLLGQKRAIIAGAIVLMGSYFGLSLVFSDQGLIAALAGITVGTGLLKPNISSLLGNEYPEGSPNRESGFTIFYLGITTGIILGTTVPSYLSRYFGWSTAFLSASFGMVIALATFAYGIARYKMVDYHPFVFQVKKILFALLLMVLMGSAAFYILKFPAFADTIFILVVLCSLGYLIYCISQEAPLQAKQTAVISLLCIISVIFWAFYFQMFLSLTLFIVRVVQPKLFGIAFPPPYYVGVQSLGMIILGFLIATRPYVASSTIHQGIRTGNKFILALLFILLAYGLITLVAHFNYSATRLSPLYIIPAYLLISLAELYLSPVGLAAITILASRKKVSTMMGIFFVSLGIGAYLSGKLANLTAIPIGEHTTTVLKAHYAHAFTHLLLILIAATLVAMGLNYLIKYLLRES